MAYVLGYWFADGSIYPSVRGSYINVTSIDKETIFKIKEWLKSEHKIVREKFPNSNRKERFLLRVGNKILYNSLLKLGIYPNKSLTVKFPDVPKKFLPHFLRGYFDGDGCVFLEMGRGVAGQKIIKRLSVIFTSGSQDFLQKLCYSLKKILDLKQNKVYLGHRSYQLRYFTQDSIKLFKFLYKDCQKKEFLPRKFRGFKSYFDLRPQKVNADIREIFEKHGHVAK